MSKIAFKLSEHRPPPPQSMGEREGCVKEIPGLEVDGVEAGAVVAEEDDELPGEARVAAAEALHLGEVPDDVVRPEGVADVPDHSRDHAPRTHHITPVHGLGGGWRSTDRSLTDQDGGGRSRRAAPVHTTGPRAPVRLCASEHQITDQKN